MSDRTRGIVSIILAIGLMLVLIIITISMAIGTHVSEYGRDAGWALLGGVAGALITYMTSSKSSSS